MTVPIPYQLTRPNVVIPVYADSVVENYVTGAVRGSVNIKNYQDIQNNRSGETLSDWRKRVANLEDATTEFHDSSYALECVPAMEDIYFDVWEPQRQHGAWMLSAAVSPVSFSECSGLVLTANNVALAKMYNRLNSQFQGLTFLGELKDAIRQLRNPAMGLRKALDRYSKDAKRVRHATARNRKIPKARRHRAYAADVGELWLEWSFGVQPTANDIRNAYDAVMDMVVDRFAENFSHRGTEIAWEKFSHTDSWIRVQNVTTGRIGLKATVQYKGAAYVDVEGSLDPAHRLGMLPEQFIPTAWELMAYSWLIDYFSNIGDVLNSWASAQRLKFVYLARTTRQVTVKTTRTVSLPSSGYNASHMTSNESRPGTGYVFAKKVDRVRVNDVPLPSAQAQFKLNWGRGLNIASLILAKQRDEGYVPFRK